MAYIHYTFDTKKLKMPEPKINLYPLVCLHVGSPQADVKFIREHLKRIAEDPQARWVYMGDGGECVTKLSKGDVYGQLLSPNSQMEMLDDLLKPIAGKGLFGIRGNHGNRIYKESGLGFDQNLMARLGMPYLGAAAMANIVVNRSTYDCYFHHGVDSGSPIHSKVAKAESFGRFIDADAIFTAHSHVAMELQAAPLIQADNVNKKLTVKMRQQYICGSAYDSRTGYAEDKGYPPLLPSYVRVTFDGRINGGYAVHKQESTRYASDGKHELAHDYVLQYIQEDKGG